MGARVTLGTAGALAPVRGWAGASSVHVHAVLSAKFQSAPDASALLCCTKHHGPGTRTWPQAPPRSRGLVWGSPCWLLQTLGSWGSTELCSPSAEPAGSGGGGAVSIWTDPLPLRGRAPCLHLTQWDGSASQAHDRVLFSFQRLFRILRRSYFLIEHYRGRMY